jgi:hypothetical protein
MVKRSKSGGPAYTSDASDMMMNLIDLRHQKEEKKIDDLAHDYLVAQEMASPRCNQETALPRRDQAVQEVSSPRREDMTQDAASPQLHQVAQDVASPRREPSDPDADAFDDEDQYRREDLPEESKKMYRVAYEEMSGNIEIEQIPEIQEVLSNENTRIITNSAYPQVIDQGFRTVVEGVLAETINEENEIPEETKVLSDAEPTVISEWEANIGPVWEKPTYTDSLLQVDGHVYYDPSQPNAFDEELDLEFVEQYDTAFNEFVATYPNFLINNPDLVHNLRVTKLQKCLERGDEIEGELNQKIEDLRLQKSDMELYYQRQLKDASRMKAAREIQLKSSLDEFRNDAKVMEARLTWDLLLSSQTRVQKLYDLRQQIKLSETPTTWEELLKMLPDDGPDAQAIRDAVLAPSLSSGTTTVEQENDLRQFQVDNAFLNAEVSVLMKKLAYQKLAAKKHAWVETVLLRMDPKAIRKLKARYQKKLGVALS